MPRRVTIDERTTVATAFALAQFFGTRGIAGKNPGLRNAAAMTRNLVGRRGGGLSPVLRRFPNGGSTTTVRTFNSLANLVAACRRPDWRCARLLHYGGGEELLRFTPIGRSYPGSPYRGGGVVGVGFGIAIDPRDHVWVGNFGFAGKGCTRKPPPGCGNESVTKYPRGNPALAINIPSSATLLGRPFGIAVNGAEQVFVTGNESHSVAMLGPDGAPVRGPIAGGGLHRPLGVAGDSRGYMWVANSTWVVAPCAGPIRPQGGPSGGGTVTLLEPDGDIAREQPFRGAGLVNPWGVAIDGDDTVWVANFGGRRVSHLCGTRTRLCPPGKRSVGASISPPRRGYGFDGLTRNTGVQVDPSGNVWLANNWKQKPIQTNPGGYQLVAYLGIAAPVKTPLIGPPERP